MARATIAKVIPSPKLSLRWETGEDHMTKRERTQQKLKLELRRLKSVLNLGHELGIEWLPCSWGEEALDEETVEVD